MLACLKQGFSRQWRLIPFDLAVMDLFSLLPKMKNRASRKSKLSASTITYKYD
jgi:hypothetical protein